MVIFYQIAVLNANFLSRYTGSPFSSSRIVVGCFCQKKKKKIHTHSLMMSVQFPRVAAAFREYSKQGNLFYAFLTKDV